MPNPITELDRLGRAWSPQDDERQVEQPPQSLKKSATANLSTAWEVEVQERLAAYDRGEVRAVDAAAVFAKARSLAR